MRTTLTLDDDVAAALDRLRKARDVGLKDSSTTFFAAA